MEQRRVQQFAPHAAVVALDEAILHRPAQGSAGAREVKLSWARR